MTENSSGGVREKQSHVATDLADANEYMETLLQTSHDGILVVDAEGRFEYGNDAFFRTFGWPRDEVIGHFFIKVVVPELHEFMMERWAEVQRGEGAPYETEIMHKNGERRALLVSHRHMTIRGQRKYCVVTKDITERKRSERELQAHRDRLEHMVEARTRDLTLANDRLQESMLQLQEISEALKEREANFRTLIENADEGIVIEQPGGNILYANPRACAMTGYTADELLQMNSSKLLPETERERVQQITARRLASESVPSPYESVIVANDGTQIPVEITGARTVWRGQAATIGMLRDITARKQAENALQHSQLTLARAQAIAHVGSWEWEPQTGVLHWSEEMYRLHGLDPSSDSIDVERIRKLNHEDDVATVEEATSRTIRDNVPLHLEYRIRRPDGAIRCMLAHGQMDNTNGDTPRMIGTLLDVTDRRELEREIVEATRAEQERIGQDIHDALGQELTGISFLAKALERRLEPVDADLANRAAEIVRLASLSAAHARDIAHGLAPVDIPEEGLAAELGKLAERAANMYDITCVCEFGNDHFVYNNEIATHLYHIAQEATSNAARHGNPSHVQITLVGGEHGQLRIHDNGHWRAPGTDAPRGLGLRIMKHRADIVGGKLSIDHEDQAGTTITCEFPNRQSTTSADTTVH